MALVSKYKNEMLILKQGGTAGPSSGTPHGLANVEKKSGMFGLDILLPQPQKRRKD